MSEFPLYDSLSKNIPETDLSFSEKRAFIKRFEKIDHEGHELVYAVIRMYQMVNNEQNTSFTLPTTVSISITILVLILTGFQFLSNKS